MRKKVICLITALVFMSSSFVHAFGVQNSECINITLPSFMVIMNGQVVNVEMRN